MSSSWFCWGPCRRSYRTSDAAGNVLNGRYVSYTASGYADTLGYYVNGRRNGLWTIYRPDGRMAHLWRYKDGQLISKKDTTAPERKAEQGPASADSSDAKFSGTARDWLRFLNQNLRYPDDAVNKEIMGTVVVTFLVDSTGKIPLESIWVNRSICYSLDRETIRVISISPAWDPAMINGRRVNSFERQPMVFRLERQ